MEHRTIQVDNVPTVIRTMGDDYIVGEDPVDAGIKYAIKCWPGKNVPGEWPNRPIAVYFRKILKAYGSSAVTAWQGRRLVGFLPFMPLNCGMPNIEFCVVCPENRQTPINEIAAAEPVPFDELNPKVLKVQCASVAWNPPLYRKGIGTAMLQYLIQWAREGGWEQIEGWAFSDSNFFDAYKWIPSIHFWTKSGFSKVSDRIEDMKELGHVSVSDFRMILK